jgi:hypothetical protein
MEKDNWTGQNSLRVAEPLEEEEEEEQEQEEEKEEEQEEEVNAL